MSHQNAVVLLSGGLDSAIAATYLTIKGLTVVGAVFINRGQSNYEKERTAVEQVSKLLGIPLYKSEFSIPDLATLVPKEVRSKVGIPGRNLIIGALTLPYLYALNSDLLVLGNIASDIFPDSNKEFRVKFSAVASQALGHSIEVVAPLADWENWGKADEIIFASKNGLEALFSLTWTCWGGGELHCGTCKACLGRRDGFAKAGIADPTIYEGTKS